VSVGPIDGLLGLVRFLDEQPSGFLTAMSHSTPPLAAQLVWLPTERDYPPTALNSSRQKQLKEVTVNDAEQ
jgi:hypothetical protein